MYLKNENEGSVPMIEIESEQEFNRIIELPKAIIYFQVNWSGPERTSRAIINMILNEIVLINTPIFRIDYSDRLEFIEKWMLLQTKNVQNLLYGGWGETVLIENGQVTDFINYPTYVGIEKTKEKIENWQNKSPAIKDHK